MGARRHRFPGASPGKRSPAPKGRGHRSDLELSPGQVGPGVFDEVRLSGAVIGTRRHVTSVWWLPCSAVWGRRAELVDADAFAELGLVL